MRHNYSSHNLVTIDNEQSLVNIYEDEKSKFEETFLVSKLSKIFIGKSPICRMIEMSEARESSDFDGNTVLLESDDNDFIFIFGFEIIKFSTED